MKKIKIFFVAILIAFTFAISGCSTVPVKNTPIIEQQSLLQLCGTDTPIPTNFVINEKGEKVYNGKELYTVLRDWQTYYNQCAAMHNQLVRTILELQDMKDVPKK
ncbi:structural protein [Pectobacterium phage vB_PcaM_CBB]|uniref:Structural protein n=1 Tax=Pectobacterium phage vB_PcaM_CBB TaxID=2772511 RepID=A0A1L2CUM3_9CAUD|nr:structural protein [Pectobacterium phage vB_PcaM_CBB]AMM43730.1 structural protein [Pectobacterium phage vB_PcaM_CBB]